jgi:hypothetical protein
LNYHFWLNDKSFSFILAFFSQAIIKENLLFFVLARQKFIFGSDDNQKQTKFSLKNFYHFDFLLCYLSRDDQLKFHGKLSSDATKSNFSFTQFLSSIRKKENISFSKFLMPWEALKKIKVSVLYRILFRVSKPCYVIFIVNGFCIAADIVPLASQFSNNNKPR